MSTTQQEQTRAAAPQEYLLEMRGITKAFAGVQALKGGDFYVRPGTVHALMGENGAGKSTATRVQKYILMRWRRSRSNADAARAMVSLPRTARTSTLSTRLVPA